MEEVRYEAVDDRAVGGCYREGESQVHSKLYQYWYLRALSVILDRK